MVDVSRKPNVEIAILPQSAWVPASPLNIFVIYDDRLVKVELFSGEVVLRDPRDISHHLNLFDLFLEHSLRGAEAAAFLCEASEEFMRLRD